MHIARIKTDSQAKANTSDKVMWAPPAGAPYYPKAGLVTKKFDWKVKPIPPGTKLEVKPVPKPEPLDAEAKAADDAWKWKELVALMPKLIHYTAEDIVAPPKPWMYAAEYRRQHNPFAVPSIEKSIMALYAAADFLTEDTWTKGFLARDGFNQETDVLGEEARRFCAGGAVMKMLGHRLRGDIPLMHAMKVATYRASGGRWDSLPTFNDYHATTLEQVKGVLRDAARLLETGQWAA